MALHGKQAPRADQKGEREIADTHVFANVDTLMRMLLHESTCKCTHMYTSQSF